MLYHFIGGGGWDLLHLHKPSTEATVDKMGQVELQMGQSPTVRGHLEFLLCSEQHRLNLKQKMLTQGKQWLFVWYIPEHGVLSHHMLIEGKIVGREYYMMHHGFLFSDEI